MSPSAPDYAWFHGNELYEAYCMTYVRDVSPAEFLARLDVTPYAEQQGLHALVSTYWDDPLGLRDVWQFVGATSVPGRDGPWTLAVEVNGFMGHLAEYMGPASAGARIFSHCRNLNCGPRFDWWEDGELRTSFEWPWQRHGSTPDDLLDAMARVGFDLDPQSEEPGAPGHLALAEELTGVRVTDDLLSRASYATGYVKLRPVTGGESPQPERRRGLGRGLTPLVPPPVGSAQYRTALFSDPGAKTTGGGPAPYTVE